MNARIPYFEAPIVTRCEPVLGEYRQWVAFRLTLNNNPNGRDTARASTKEAALAKLATQES